VLKLLTFYGERIIMNLFNFTKLGRMLALTAVLVVGLVCWIGCGGDDDNPGNNGGAGKGGVSDPIVYEGQTYKTVKIGNQRWMAENLNYKPLTGGSWCHLDLVGNCDKYGMLYDWATAMDISAEYNTNYWNGSDVKHQGVCPSGWHLPSRAEWDTLAEVVGGTMASDYGKYHFWEGAGRKLKATTNWAVYDSRYGPGTDDYGFAALAASHRDQRGLFSSLGWDGCWWTATENDSGRVYHRAMIYSDDLLHEADRVEGKNQKGYGMSVRCIQN
jgi:uncharacterized protein (TIGR02145 family)